MDNAAQTKDSESTGIDMPVEHGEVATHAESFRFSLLELGGALGDLGTFLPLSVALVTLNDLNPTGVFFIAGSAYVLAGVFYRLPMPVQPLKAVAAIAIASGLSATVVSASGLVMGALLLLLATTGAVDVVARLFPRPIIRGVQLGVGLLLIRAGLSLIGMKELTIGGGEHVFTVGHLSIPMGWLLAAALGGVFLLSLRSRTLPASLALLAFGISIGVLAGSLEGLRSFSWHPGLSLPTIAVPSLSDLSTALTLLVVPQLPLTLGNAVFAPVDTAKAYFGPRARRVTPRALLTTMGITNVGAALLGGIPICHGSGGLTAHYRLGARTGGAGVMMGGLFLALALLGDNALPIISLIPYPLLGILVVYVGVQHSLLLRDIHTKEEALVALAVAAVGFATTNLALGLIAGMSLRYGLRILSVGSRSLTPPVATRDR